LLLDAGLILTFQASFLDAGLILTFQASHPVRERAKLSKKCKTMETDVRLNFEMWKAARDIATSCETRMKPSKVGHIITSRDRIGNNRPTTNLILQFDYTILFPDAYDARRMMVNLCHRFKVDYLCIGKHKKGERKTR